MAAHLAYLASSALELDSDLTASYRDWLERRCTGLCDANGFGYMFRESQSWQSVWTPPLGGRETAEGQCRSETAGGTELLATLANNRQMRDFHLTKRGPLQPRRRILSQSSSHRSCARPASGPASPGFGRFADPAAPALIPCRFSHQAVRRPRTFGCMLNRRSSLVARKHRALTVCLKSN